MKQKESNDIEAAENMVSIREFARCAGVSDTAIRKRIEKGHISADSVHVNEYNGRPELYYERALKEWISLGNTMTRTPKFLNETIVPLRMPESLAVESIDKNNLFNQPPADIKDATKIKAQGVGEYAIANAKQAVFKSRMMEIELAEKEGILISKEKVYKKLFEFGQTMRTKILSIPDKHIDEIFSSEERNEAHLKLYKALNDALEQLSTNPEIG